MSLFCGITDWMLRRLPILPSWMSMYVGEQNDERRAGWMSPMCFFLFCDLTHEAQITPQCFATSSKTTYQPLARLVESEIRAGSVSLFSVTEIVGWCKTRIRMGGYTKPCILCTTLFHATDPFCFSVKKAVNNFLNMAISCSTWNSVWPNLL